MGYIEVGHTREAYILELERKFLSDFGELGSAIMALEKQVQVASQPLILNEQPVLHNGQLYRSFDISSLSLLDTAEVTWIGRGKLEEKTLLQILNEHKVFKFLDKGTRDWITAELQFKDAVLFVKSPRFSFQVTAATLNQDSYKYQQLAVSAVAWQAALAVLHTLNKREQDSTNAKLVERLHKSIKNSLPILELLQVFQEFTFMRGSSEKYTHQTNLLTLVDIIITSGQEKLYFHFDIGLESAKKVCSCIESLFSVSLEDTDFKLELPLAKIDPYMRMKLLESIAVLYKEKADYEINWVERYFSMLQERFTVLRMDFCFNGTGVHVVLENTAL